MVAPVLIPHSQKTLPVQLTGRVERPENETGAERGSVINTKYTEEKEDESSYMRSLLRRGGDDSLYGTS